VAQLVEHHLAKVGVAGSNPVVRSRKTCSDLQLPFCPGPLPMEFAPNFAPSRLWNRARRPCRGVLGREGPQRSDLAPDIAEALKAEPAAGMFFDSLGQFYRKAYLR
jgi:hypothetical protein